MRAYGEVGELVLEVLDPELDDLEGNEIRLGEDKDHALVQGGRDEAIEGGREVEYGMANVGQDEEDVGELADTPELSGIE